MVAAYSPRLAPACRCPFPSGGTTSTTISPRDFTITTQWQQLGGRDPWAEAMPPDQELPADLLAEGHEIPIPRVAAMHEGKRRKAKERKA